MSGRSSNLEALSLLRIAATVLVVVYHVIGNEPGSGLRIATTHPLRTFADALADFRMPVFAFVSGTIYALRPTSLDGYGRFISGKLRRLAVPGLFAALAFAALSRAFDTKFAIPADGLWRIVVYPYAHFWYLQAIIAIFAVVALVDALTRQRASLAMLGLALALAFSARPLPGAFSLDRTVILAPMFLIGLCHVRYADWLRAHVAPLSMVAAAVLAVWLAWFFAGAGLPQTGTHAFRTAKAIISGTSLCFLALHHLPRVPMPAWLRHLAFTVYLYHVLGTAGTRMALHQLGIDDLAIHVTAGTVGGLLFPLLVHLAASQSPVSARWLLGTPAPGVPRLSRRLAGRAMPA